MNKRRIAVVAGAPRIPVPAEVDSIHLELKMAARRRSRTPAPRLLFLRRQVGHLLIPDHLIGENRAFSSAE